MACGSCGTTSTCSCSDNVLTFPAGAQGPKGDKGAQGPKGDTGATGPAGSNGTVGPISVTKFVKTISPVSGTTVAPNAITAGELTTAGMLRNVYDANTGTANTSASAMDFVYNIWYEDTSVSPPIWSSATEGTSPRCVGVVVNELNNVDFTFSVAGGNYRVVVEG